MHSHRKLPGVLMQRPFWHGPLRHSSISTRTNVNNHKRNNEYLLKIYDYNLKNLPMQWLWSGPIRKPESQTHLKDPSMFTHFPFSHIPLVEHSSMSTQKVLSREAVNPGWQMQWYDPGVFSHLPFRHILGLSAHSLISVSKQLIIYTSEYFKTLFLAMKKNSGVIIPMQVFLVGDRT